MATIMDMVFGSDDSDEEGDGDFAPGEVGSQSGSGSQSDDSGQTDGSDDGSGSQSDGSDAPPDGPAAAAGRAPGGIAVPEVIVLSSSEGSDSDTEHTKWACARCTFKNTELDTACAVCQTDRQPVLRGATRGTPI